MAGRRARCTALNDFTRAGQNIRIYVPMKLENFSNLYFIVSVLVPGFIYRGVISNFVPLRQHKDKERIILGFLTATAFNYAFCSFFIYLLVFGVIFPNSLVWQAFCWFAIILVAPVIMALSHAIILQKDALNWLYRLIRLRSIGHIPTGWDFIFSTTEPCYLLLTLKDGTEIAGYFGQQSMASSDPEHKDIYIERVYQVTEAAEPWKKVEDSRGMYIDASQIAYIELRS